jgi:hypothetical protein
MKKTLYLIGAIVGTVLPYYFLIQFLLQHGFNLPLFVQQLFANPIATMFAVDLFIASFVFWVFLYAEGRRLAMGNLWVYVVLNLTVGLSLALPLFLYFREGTMARLPASEPDATYTG